MPERVQRLAVAFAESLGWPGKLALEPREDRLCPPPDSLEVLTAAVTAPRPNDVRWWRTTAQAWSDCQRSSLAAECIRNARELVTGGVAADVADLIAIAGLSESIRTNSARVVRPRSRWKIASDTGRAKRSRLRAALGRDTSPARRPADFRTLVISEVWRCDGQFTSELAYGFHAIGEHRVVIEQVLAEVGRRGLAAARSTDRDMLIWAGLSLARAGDRVSSYACLRIALGTARILAPVQNAENDPDPVRTQAVAALATVRHEASRLGSAVGEFRILSDGVRLGHWLAENAMEGLFPEFAQNLANAPLGRHAAGVLRRQLSWQRRRCGWFEGHSKQIRRAMLPSRRPAAFPDPATLPPPRRRLVRDRTLTPDPEWRPRPVGPVVTPSDPGGHLTVSVPIGVLADGGEAALSVGAGSRVMLMGRAFRGGLLSSLATWLAAAGNMVLVVRADDQSVDEVEASWHYLSTAGSGGGVAVESARQIAASASLQASLRGCFDALPRCADVRASACLDALVDVLSSSSGACVITSDDDQASHELACQLVDRVARLTYTRVADLRRAALLVEHTIAAIAAIRRGLAVRLEQPAERTGDRGSVVCLELPGDDPSAAAVRLAVYASSLIESWQDATPTDAEAGFMEMQLTVSPRDDDADEALIAAARELASRTPYDPAPAPVDKPGLWKSEALAGLGEAAGLTVLVHAEMEIVWHAVRGLLGEAARPHALVVAAEQPTLAAIGSLSRFEDILAGSLTPGMRDLVEVALGCSAPMPHDPPCDDQTAVLVRGRAAPPGRMIIWPQNPKEVDRDGG